MIGPKDIVKYVGIVLAVLLLISLCFPESEHQIGKHSIKFPSVADIFEPRKVAYADISELIAYSETIVDTVVAKEVDLVAQTNVEIGEKIVAFDTIRANASALKTKIHYIQFPDNDNNILFPFFSQLAKVNRLERPVRIMHYGDSQIEGDRITSFVRHRLQSRFGGSGPGLLPVVQPYGQFSMKQDVSKNWKRYTLFGKKDSTLYHNRYGALASFCRFAPHKEKLTGTYEAWINNQYGVMSYKTARNYNNFKVYYGHNKKPFIAQLFEGDALIDAEMVGVSNQLKTLEWHFDHTPSSLKMEFKGEDSPDFYALSFESNNGVVMDNIPMRGSSGLVFTKMDRSLLKKMFDALKVDLIILQYGGNAVPYISNGYERYGKLFYDQLVRIQSVAPGIPILVIGVADMSIKEKGYYKTYPVLPKVRDALKDAAFKAGCAYWDMFEAMGGENSMPSWVFAEPPLASTDFVHFNHRGARLIAEMFYNALVYEYERYSGIIKEPGAVASN